MCPKPYQRLLAKISGFFPVLLVVLWFAAPGIAQVIATNCAIYRSAELGPYFHAEWQHIEPGRNYQLQFSGDARHWFALESVTNSCSTNAPWVQQTPLTNHAKCFFRIQESQ